ncbi:hypothetical protein ACHAWC_011201 [Mediolabrus comicus]
MNLAVFQDYARSLTSEECIKGYYSVEEENADAKDASVIPSNVGVDKEDAMVIIKQHNDANAHTGGIVWETAYLLALFLSSKFGNNKADGGLGKTLEIGAGLGMLGLILAANKLASRVVVTETEEVMEILIDNVNQNVIEAHDKKKSVHGTPYFPVCPKECISVRQLRWDCLQDDISYAAADRNREEENDLEPHSFDTIVGTDVVFSPSLVCPLLETIQCMARMKNEYSASTRIYLCLQIRCSDSHKLLFSEAHKYGLEVIDITDELSSICPWAVELECLLLQINVTRKVSKEVSKKRKKSSKEKSKKKHKKKSERSSKKRKRVE